MHIALLLALAASSGPDVPADPARAAPVFVAVCLGGQTWLVARVGADGVDPLTLQSAGDALGGDGAETHARAAALLPLVRDASWWRPDDATPLAVAAPTVRSNEGQSAAVYALAFDACEGGEGAVRFSAPSTTLEGRAALDVSQLPRLRATFATQERTRSVGVRSFGADAFEVTVVHQEEMCGGPDNVVDVSRVCLADADLRAVGECAETSEPPRWVRVGDRRIGVARGGLGIVVFAPDTKSVRAIDVFGWYCPC